MSPLKNHFYISLDTEKERKIFMEAQFKKIGIMERTIRFPAIDAKSPDALANTNYKLGGWRPRWSLTPTEIAIFESHRALWQNIINEGLDFAIIMEDDIFISKEILTVVNYLKSDVSQFDIIRLDGCKGRHRYGPIYNVGSIDLRPILQTVPSAACYMLSRAGAKRLLDGSKVYSDHVDDYLFTPKANWKAFQLWPAIAVQGMFSQAISNTSIHATILKSARTSIASEVTAPHKGPIPYRLYKEFRRAYVKCTRKFYSDKKLICNGGEIGCPPLAHDLPLYLP